ncbi:MAG: toll/interleukin-1 receptor domain-containing protein [Chloroflexota bacterium]
MQYHAFLSYSRADASIMRRVRSDLINAGLTIWSDDNLEPGEHSWKDAIEEAIQNSLSLIVLLSPDAKHSEWVEREITYADALGIKIIPVMVRGVDEISAVPFELINTQRIDLRADHRAGMAKLIETIQHIADIDAVSPRPQASYTAHANSKMEKLVPMSFYDHVKLFIWIFWQPQKLSVYANKHGAESLEKTASWLASDFVWIVFMAPALGVIIGTVQLPTDSPLLLSAMQGLSIFVFIAGWFMTGMLGWRNDALYGTILLVVTTLVIFGLFYSINFVAGGIMSEAGGLTRPAFLMSLGLLLTTGAGIAFRLAQPIIGTVAGLLLGSIFFNATVGVQLGLDGGIAGLVMFANVILVAWVVDNSFKTGTRTSWHLLSFGVILISGFLSVVLYFLGGWIFLRGL